MTYQSEAILEQELLQQLAGMGYHPVRLADEEGILVNLKEQLQQFNNTAFSDREFNHILNHLNKGNIFERAKTLRDRFALERDNGKVLYVQFLDPENVERNRFQVSQQITQEGSYKNRYDVTILVNGLPLVQIELKRRGIELKEAFNQINRYKRHSFWANSGLFQYVQLFVISNGVNSKYYANNPIQSLSFKQTFYWAQEDNRNITELEDFTSSFLTHDHLHKMLTKYIVLNETHRILMALRPYQYYAVENIVKSVAEGQKNGYIWHTTGSGKTLTSFKASQVIMEVPHVHKVVFVVDRKDLDYQTANEFNAFKKGSVDMTDNTKELIDQLNDDTKLVVTTIQKLNNAVSKASYHSQIDHLRLAHIVFIFDECHRSQFGETHQKIVGFFKHCQLFGFTGTPIFAENAAGSGLAKKTTKDLFGECLHKYVITDAIRDENVLKFAVEYVGKYKNTSRNFVDIEVEDIDTKEVLESDKRLEKIVDHIIHYHDQKTHGKDYSAIFAVSSIDMLIKYYEKFREKREAGEHNLRLATIFSYGANEEDYDAMGLLPGDEDLRTAADPEVAYRSSHTRDKLESFIGDYNKQYGVSFTTKDSKQFENYYKDISKRLKAREKTNFQDKDRLDILLVVNMFLTGFDAKKVNTLYVDKNLRYHGLIQAYSRTNRILNEQKSQGNIVCYRNLKKNTDDAVTLYSNKDALEEIFLPPYETIRAKFDAAFEKLLTMVPTVNSVNDLASEDDQAAFVQSFRELMRIKNVLATHNEFDWEDLEMTEQQFEDYKGKYLDLYERVRREKKKEKDSILEDIDFELELIHRDEINVAYILKLLAQLKEADATEQTKQKQKISELLAGDIQLRSKRELIEKFIEEQLPKISDMDRLRDEFEKYWEEQKIMALQSLCEKENLDQQQFAALIDAYIFSGQEPLKDDILKCLDQRPSLLQARTIADRIMEEMKEHVERFYEGVVA